MDKQIEESITRQFKAIFPNTLNANDTLFGGHAIQWMDEVAYITATRFTRKRMFTLSIEKIKFLKQIHPDTIIEIIGRIERVTDIRLFIKVEIFAEEMYDSNKEKKIEGIFEFVALDAHQKPERLLHNKLVL